MELNELYQDLILDHFKHPRCKGCLECPDASQSLHNPLCGDQILVGISVKDKQIPEIVFSGQGCSISQASASMMTEACRGKTVPEVRHLIEEFRAMMRGEEHTDDYKKLGDAVALEGVRKFAARVRCVMLAWEALERCLEKIAPQKA